ncbi:hypothetical protein D3C74_50790 [compost metagenome]
MQEIVKDSQNRFDYWIMEKWNVLPTDPRFLALTEEQKDWLWENFLLSNPEVKRKIDNRFHDPDFDRAWEELGGKEVEETETYEEAAESRNSEEEDEYGDLELAYKGFLAERKDMAVPDKFSQVMEQLGTSESKETDWEEVDD